MVEQQQATRAAPALRTVTRENGVIYSRLGAGAVALLAAALTMACSLASPAPAAALPACSEQPASRLIVNRQGRLESIIADGRGRIYVTDLTENRLLRLDGPDQEPKVLARDIPRPGGLAFDADGSLVTGFSGGALSGLPGSAMGGLLRIDPETGTKQPFVAGLDQANGLARGPDGSFYTSNNIGGEIVRVFPDGRVEDPWVQLDSPNGLVIDSAEQHLYAAQTFRPANIARISLADPGQVTSYFAAGPDDAAAGLDGLTRDGADRLYVAANGAGEVWRVEPDGTACTLAEDLLLPSNVSFGGGAGFPPENLYVVTFGGDVVELPDATDAPPAPPTGAPGPSACFGEPATVVGGAEADKLRGTPGRDVVVSGAGADRIRTGAGADLICAGQNADLITAGGSRDKVRGGSGQDRVGAAGGDDVLKGDGDEDWLSGGLGGDRLQGDAGGDNLLGGPGADVLEGNRGLDRASGGRGNDRCWSASLRAGCERS
jgi:sugar lactone lactonase YvrE